MIYSEEELKNNFGSQVCYEWDPSNSHSGILFEGMMVKFTNTFFKYFHLTF